MSTDTAVIFPDPDTLQIVKYLTFQLSAQEVIMFEERLATDVAFRVYALPLIVVWTIPRPLAARGLLRGFRLRRLNPHSLKSRQREWDRLFRAAGMKSEPMARILDDAFHPPRRAKKIFWSSVGLAFALFVAWIALWWRIAQRETLQQRTVPSSTMLFGASFYEATTTARTVSRSSATFTVYPNSRMVMSWRLHIAAMDGHVDVVVPPGQIQVIESAGVPTKLTAGRYQVWHPVGNTTRIVADSGWMQMIPLGSPGDVVPIIRFNTGAAVTAVQHGKLTTLSAVYKDGTVVEPVIVRNRGITP